MNKIIGSSLTYCIIIYETYQKIMFSIIENHIDRFILQNDFLEGNDIFVRYLSVELSMACRI